MTNSFEGVRQEVEFRDEQIANNIYTIQKLNKECYDMQNHLIEWQSGLREVVSFSLMLMQERCEVCGKNK